MELDCLNNLQNLAGLRNINNQVKKNEIKNNETENIEQPKKQMVDAQTALINYTVPKINMSFKGNLQNNEVNLARFTELSNMNVPQHYIEYFYDLDEQQYEKAKECMLNDGMEPRAAADFAKLSTERQEKIASIVSKRNVAKNYIKYNKIGDLDETQYKRFCSLCDNGFGIYYAADIATNEALCDKAILLLNKGAASFDINSILKKGNDTQYQRFISLLENGIESYYAKEIALLNDNQYEKCIFLIKNDEPIYDVITLSQYDDKTYNKYIELKQRGINGYYAMKISEADDKIYERFNTFFEQGLSVDAAQKAALFNESEDEVYKNLTEIKEIKPDTAVNIIPYMFFKNYEHIINLAKKGIINDKWNIRDIDVFINSISNNNELNNKVIFLENQSNICNLISKNNCRYTAIKNLVDSEQKDLLHINEVAGNETIKKLADENKIQDILILNKFNDTIMNNIDFIVERIEKQRENMLNRPDLYVSGEFEDIESAKKELNDILNCNYSSFILANSVFDDKTMDALLRTRIVNTINQLAELDFFNKNDFELLSKLAKSKNKYGSEFTSKQKLGFIDLISAYKNCGLDLNDVQKQAENGVADIEQLNKNLFEGILKNCGLTAEEIGKIPDDKLTSWNMQYMYLLAKENDFAFADLLKAANLDDFNKYIHDTSNEYGQANAETTKAFADKKMDYDKWLKPSQENNVQFVSKDNNAERLSQISSQIKEDMETLMQTPAKGFIKKQFPNYIKDGKFVIPPETENSKAQLNEFTQNILKQLTPVFVRSKNNPKNPETAQRVLTIQDHLNQRVKDIENVGEIKSAKTLDWTIKMWDRNPQHDLFQGNYSTCCIGIGNMNSSAMPHYLMNTAYNMIEIKDNKTDNTIGNALCYFVEDEQGKPAFIIDNIEINNSNKPSDEAGKDLRNKIAEYAANVAKEVTGSDDTPIYMSNQYNDVPADDLEKSEQKISFIGSIDCDEIYMDLYNGWIEKENLAGMQKLLKLK